MIQIEPMQHDDIEALAKRQNFAEAIVKQIVPGAAFDGSVADLDWVQRALNSGQLSKEDTIDLQSLGALFARVFLNVSSGYSWWIVNDDAGRDPCLRYAESDLLVHPLTIISQRIEQGQVVHLRTLLGELQQQLLVHSSRIDQQSH